MRLNRVKEPVQSFCGALRALVLTMSFKEDFLRALVLTMSFKEDFLRALVLALSFKEDFVMPGSNILGTFFLFMLTDLGVFKKL